MPTYDYVCRKCGHRFEHFQPMSEAVLVKCPKCGRDQLERLIGAGAGFLFKGSGFYQTDYKRAVAPKSETPAAPAAPEKRGAPEKQGAPDKQGASDKPAKPDKPAAGGPATGKSAGDKPSAPSKDPGPSKGPAKSD